MHNDPKRRAIRCVSIGQREIINTLANHAYPRHPHPYARIMISIFMRHAGAVNQRRVRARHYFRDSYDISHDPEAARVRERERERKPGLSAKTLPRRSHPRRRRYYGRNNSRLTFRADDGGAIFPPPPPGGVPTLKVDNRMSGERRERREEAFFFGVRGWDGWAVSKVRNMRRNTRSASSRREGGGRGGTHSRVGASVRLAEIDQA